MDRASISDLQRVAADQHGLFTLTQARELGLAYQGLRQALARGWIRLVRRGVYAFRGHPPSSWEPVLAASLAAGPTATISHRSAAEIHRFWGMAAIEPELTVLGPAGRSLSRVRLHRSTGLHAGDLVVRSGVRVTSPIRTLLDIAPMADDYQLPRIIDEGAIARLWTAEKVLARLEELSPERRPGGPRLRQLLALGMDEASPDSQLEQRVIRAIKPWVPPFEVHHRLELGGRIIEVGSGLAGLSSGRRDRGASSSERIANQVRLGPSAFEPSGDLRMAGRSTHRDDGCPDSRGPVGSILPRRAH